MAWLSNWAKRYKIEIDHTKVDQDLTNFPVMIPVFSGTGLSSFDTDGFYTELSSSGTLVFSENFTASGTNWTHTGTQGTSYPTTGGNTYMYQAAINGYSYETSNSSFEIGKYWDVKGRIQSTTWANHGSQQGNIYFGYDGTSTNYAIRFHLYNYSTSVGSYYFRFYKKTGTDTSIVLDTTWNYSSEINTWWWARCRREDTKLYVKIWKEPYAEPTAWMYEVEGAYNDSDRTSGNIMVYSYYQNTYYDDISIRTFTPTPIKKIAVTSDDGVTQLPVEIEYYDDFAKKCFLWTKMPTVSSGTNTTFYLYFDKTKDDNVNYVGYTDSTPAEQVWDSNYLFVGHMNITPNKGYLKDSTSNNVDSASFSVDVNDYYLAPGGTSYSFDNTASDKISFSTNNAVTNISGALTVEAVFNLVGGNASYPRGIAHKGTDLGVTKKAWFFDASGVGPFYMRAEISNTGSHVASYSCYSPASYDLNTWYYSVFRFTPSVESIIKMNDTTAVVNTTSVPSSLYVSSTPAAGDEFQIGVIYRTDNSNYFFDGEIGEVRISKIARSDAWLKASYHTAWNTFLTFNPLELAPSYYYQGYIKEKGLAAARTVRLYRRTNGGLMDETTSASGNGYYYLTTSYNEDHFVVVFDDEAGDVYNALILDRLDPTGIE